MKYLTRNEFEQLAGLLPNASYQRKSWPEPCKRLSRTGQRPPGKGGMNGVPTPIWSMEVVESYMQSKVKLDYMEVKRLNDQGLTRNQMAEKLNIGAQKLRSFCRYNKIISLSTLKDKSRKAPKIQPELFPIVRILNTFETFLTNHVKAIKSLG